MKEGYVADSLRVSDLIHFIHSDLAQLNIFIAIGLPLGFVANFVGAMFAFAEGTLYCHTELRLTFFTDFSL